MLDLIKKDSEKGFGDLFWYTKPTQVEQHQNKWKMAFTSNIEPTKSRVV